MTILKTRLPVSANDLYSSTEYTVGTLDALLSYSENSLLKEVDFETTMPSTNLYKEPPERVQIRLLKDHSFDSKYVWILGTLWFDSLPVMVFQRGGRYGEALQSRFITNLPRFIDMCKYFNAYIYQLKLDTLTDTLEEINQDESRDDLDTFNGYNVNSHFEYY